MVNSIKFIILLGTILLFGLSRMINLSSFPVFADEAIYIRWAQMINFDHDQYLFLPMYDGKTPLFMWIMTQFLNIVPLDPLWGARFMSVVFGFITMMVLVMTIKLVGGSRRAQILAALLYSLLPFTLFHDRMALIDGMLATWLALSFYLMLKFKFSQKPIYIILSGIFWGLALWTKVPALFMAPIFILNWLLVPTSRHSLSSWKESFRHIRRLIGSELKNIILVKKINSQIKILFSRWLSKLPSISALQNGGQAGKQNDKTIKEGLWFILGGIIGLSLLYSLRVSELFPFLFTRSQDFSADLTRTLPDILSLVWTNILRVSRWLSWYLSIPVLLAPLFIHILPLKSKTNYVFNPLLLSFFGLVFALPLILVGQVLAARYFYPVIIWFIPAAALAIDEIWINGNRKIVLIGLGLVLIHSLYFAYPLLTNPDATPFAHEDRVQYLEEWSSGHGIKQVKDFIRERAQNNSVLVLTEGYFGTLPDGLFLYFDQDPVQKNLEVQGIGQPIHGIPEEWISKAGRREVYVVVNSHRMMIEDLSAYNLKLINEYPRPNQAPSLQLYQVNNVQKNDE